MESIVIDEIVKSEIINYINNTSITYTNIYLVGSRVWGFYSINSDYDIFVETTEIHDTIRVELNTVRVDLKFYNKGQIFTPYLDKYNLPRFNILDGNFYNVDKLGIIAWIMERKRSIPSYFNRNNFQKKWHHNLLNLENDEIY